MLPGMLATLSLWIALSVILFGVGSGALRCAGRTIDSAEDAFTSFWLGWASTVAVLQIWNLFAPIGAPSFWSMAALGAIGIHWNRKVIATGWANFRRQLAERPLQTCLLIGAGVLCLLWLANRAMGPITPKGDAGIYHVTAIRWLQSYPVVPGLENLGWLYNNSPFLFLAMLDIVPGPPHFYHLGNPLLIIAFSAQASMYLWQVVRQRERVEGHRLLGCLWLAGIVPYYFIEFSSTSTDIVNLMLGLLLGSHFFKIVFQPLDLGELGFHVVLVILLSAIGFCNKLSFAFLGATASAVAVLRFVEVAVDGHHRDAISRLRPFLSTVLLTGCLTVSILLPWVIRGYIYSGYVAYPSTTALSLDVDWKVPEADLIHENTLIRIIARAPDDRRPEVLDSWDWFFPWLRRTALRADIFTVPLTLFATMLVAYGIRARSRRQDLGAALRFLTPPLVALVLWFLTAPAERYAGGVFWLLGAGMLAIYFQQAPSEEARRRIVRGSLAFIAATLAVVLVVSAELSQRRYGWSVFVRPGPEGGFHPIPDVEVTTFATDSGLELNTPVRVRNPSSSWVPAPFCWDAPLPCTHRPQKSLELRRPGDLSGGFRIRRAIEP